MSRRVPVPVHLAVAGIVILATSAVVMSGVQEDAASQDSLAVGTGAVVLGLIAYLRYAVGHRWLSASMTYLALFWCFHYGLAFTAVLDPSLLEEFSPYEIAWLYTSTTRYLLLLTVTGAVGFVLGSALYTPARTPAPESRDGDSMLWYGGWIVMLAGLTSSAILLIQRGGIGLFSVGYMEIRSQVLAPTALPIALDMSQFGCMCALCGAAPGRRLRPLVAWSPLGVLLLALGLRTEVLVPALAFTVVLVHRGVVIPRGVMFAAVVGLLVVVPAIKNVRLVGFNNRAEVAWADQSPLATFTELGGTLHAAKAYVDWIESGDDYLLGASYWAPIDRQVLTRLMPDREPVAVEDDVRVPSRLIEQEGAVGLSATGEAYYNFGAAGPLLFYACIGALFAWLERRAYRSAYATATVGVAMLIFDFNIRGGWLPVPGRMGLGLAMLAACHLAGRQWHIGGVPYGVHSPASSSDGAIASR